MDGDRAGGDLHHRRRRGAASSSATSCPAAGRAICARRAPPARLRVHRLRTRVSIGRTRCSRGSSAARSSPWRRTAPISSSCSGCCRRARSRMRRRRSSASGFVVFFSSSLFLMHRRRALGVLPGPARSRVTDQIFPTFIIEHMPHGLVGLIVAAIVAATMSTHSGAINSLAGATTHDIYLPLTGRTRGRSAARCAWAGCFALGWGIVLTARRPALPAGHQDAGRRRRARHRVVHVRRTARRLLPRYLLAARRSSATRSSACRSGSRRWRSSSSRSSISAAVPSLAATLAPFAAIAWPWYVLIGTAITLARRHPVVAARIPTPAAHAGARMTFIVVGVDGGGSKTRAIVADETGTQLGEVVGPGERRAARAGGAVGRRDRATPCATRSRRAR